MRSISLVVLISGNGSNLQAILDAIQDGKLNASVKAVISNKKNAYGLERAKLAGVPAIIFPKYKEQSRSDYDKGLAKLVSEYQPDWIVLAGWMKILTMPFLSCFPNRVVNLHPALPGMFSGVNAIERAFQAFQTGEISHSGVMVHLVSDEGVDSGPILNQRIVKIHNQDTLTQFEERIHACEHVLLVETLQRLINEMEEKNA